MQATPSARPQTAAPKQVEGGFLLSPIAPADILTPEDFTEEQRMIGEAARSFYEREVAPAGGALDQLDYELVRRILVRAGEAGFLATGVPESNGGFGLDLIPTMLELEQFARNASFTMAIATQTGIGSLPLVLYGTPEQKQRYLPGIMSGQTVCAFALSEAHSGSDALAPRTTARLDGTGRYFILNGEKQWVTNAAIADLFTVFARVDGKHLTTFLVERGWPGVSLGAEEVKMGVRGSSTRALIMEDVHVPAENVIGQVGGGHRVAFGTLNVGRARLGAGLVGASKEVLALAATYSTERTAFGRHIAEYGLIQQKLAGIATRIYGAESMLYRTGGLLAPQLAKAMLEGVDSLPEGIGYATECSMVKVFGSELYGYAADEGVQIHGGNGYSAVYPVERHYRDARVTRIFEGTNEIHRLLITERLLKLASSGALPLLDAARRTRAEMSNRARRALAGRSYEHASTFLTREAELAARTRHLTLLLIDAAVRQFRERLIDNQLLAGALSDAAIETFAIGSVVARAAKTIGNSPPKQARETHSSPEQERDGRDPRNQLRTDMASLFVSDSFERARLAVRIAAGIISGDGQGGHLEFKIDQLTTSPLIDRSVLCKRISEAVTKAAGYPF